MAGKSASIYSLKIAVATSEGGDQDANYLPDISAAGSFVGMATTTATVDAFQGDEAFHLEDQGRRTPGENKPVAIGVINGSGSTKFGAADGEGKVAEVEADGSVLARNMEFVNFVQFCQEPSPPSFPTPFPS